MPKRNAPNCDAIVRLRISAAEKQLLVAAAEASGEGLSEFVLRSALEQADQVLGLQTRITLNGAEWERFLADLDAPAAPSPGLERLLRTPSVFDR